MNRYSFQAFQTPAIGAFSECYVTVERNGVEIERHYFKTPEWALFFMRTCTALDQARYVPLTGRLTLPDNYGACVSATFYTKEQVDTLLQRITSLEHWLESLRNKARRFFELLMWGERGRV